MYALKRTYNVNLATFSQEDFTAILKKIGITKKNLALELGLSYQTVKSWYKSNPMPMYAQRYLEQSVELKKYKELQYEIEILKRILNKL